MFIDTIDTNKFSSSYVVINVGIIVTAGLMRIGFFISSGIRHQTLVEKASGPASKNHSGIESIPACEKAVLIYHLIDAQHQRPKRNWSHCLFSNRY